MPDSNEPFEAKQKDINIYKYVLICGEECKFSSD